MLDSKKLLLLDKQDKQTVAKTKSFTENECLKATANGGGSRVLRK